MAQDVVYIFYFALGRMHRWCIAFALLVSFWAEDSRQRKREITLRPVALLDYFLMISARTFPVGRGGFEVLVLEQS